MIVCPGGGYGFLASHEGPDVAEWLNTLGVTAFVLKYRLGPRYHHPAMLNDAQRAIRTVRSKAEEWKLDPHRIGIMGFSAGGHLTSTAVTHFDDGNSAATDPIDRVSCRPDLGVLVYPVISLNPPFGHMGSRNNLLGSSPPQDLVDLLSSDKQVTANTPPCTDPPAPRPVVRPEMSMTWWFGPRATVLVPCTNTGPNVSIARRSSPMSMRKPASRTSG